MDLLLKQIVQPPALKKTFDTFGQTGVNIDEKIIKTMDAYALKQIPLSLRFLRQVYNLEYINNINIFFDKIYILNLESRVDRWEHMKRQCSENGIYNIKRFIAVPGREEPHFTEWKTYQKTPMTGVEKVKYQRRGIASPGSWAILKSMWLMLREAMEMGYERILVFQDDLLFHKKFSQLFSQNVKIVPKTWKMWYLGATQHNWNHVHFQKGVKQHWDVKDGLDSIRAGQYAPLGTADGAFAVGIHCSVFQELMDLIIHFIFPFDSGPLKEVQKKYTHDVVVCFPNLVIADIRDSDLRGARDLNAFSHRFRWYLPQYNIVDGAVKT